MMHGIYKLREMLCKELEEYGNRTSLDTSALDVVDKLAHAIKNIDKVMNSGDYNVEDHSNKRSMARYSMERYTTYDSGLVEKLRGLMEEAHDERSRSEIEKLVTKMEQG